MPSVKSVRRFVDRLIPHYSKVESDEGMLSYHYYQFLCFIIIFFFIIFSANSAFLGLYKLALAQVLVICIIFFSIGVYRKSKSVTWGANTILMFTAPVTFYRAYILGGLESPMIFGWPVISVLALMTLPFRWAMVWTVLHLAFAFYFFFMNYSGIDIPVLGPASVVGNVRIAMILAVQLIMFFSVYLIKRLNSELRQKLRQENSEVINVLRAISHDLSSPITTLLFWLKDHQKKNPQTEISVSDFLQTIKCATLRIDETRNEQARSSGKSGHAVIHEEDPEKNLFEKLFNLTLILLITTFTIFGIYYVSAGLYQIGSLQFLVVAACVAGFYIYKKTGSVSIVATVIIILGSISGFIRAKMLGGISSPAFLVWPLVPLFAGGLLPMRNAIFCVSLYMGIAIYYDVCSRLGIHFQSVVGDDALLWIRISALVLVQAIVVYTIYFMKVQNRVFRSLIEDQKIRHLELLRLLTQDIGLPFKEMKHQLDAYADQEKISQIQRSLQSCLDVIQIGEGWVQTNDEKPEGIDLKEIIEEVSFLQDSAIKAKNIKLDVSLSEENIPLVVGDRVSFSFQILNNLISNSIKFTPEGGKISILIKSANDHCDLIVEDTGIGIPKDLMAHLFDPEKPTTRLGTTGEKGTGFGMPIVKMFVEKYNGMIDVQSKSIHQYPDDHGTKILIRLPTLTT